MKQKTTKESSFSFGCDVGGGHPALHFYSTLVHFRLLFQYSENVSGANSNVMALKQLRNRSLSLEDHIGSRHPPTEGGQDLVRMLIPRNKKNQ